MANILLGREYLAYFKGESLSSNTCINEKLAINGAATHKQTLFHVCNSLYLQAKFWIISASKLFRNMIN